MSDHRLRIGVDLQDLYDSAIAARDAFAAQAESLARNAGVCTHPEGLRVPADEEVPAYCKGCGKTMEGMS